MNKRAPRAFVLDEEEEKPEPVARAAPVVRRVVSTLAPKPIAQTPAPVVSEPAPITRAPEAFVIPSQPTPEPERIIRTVTSVASSAPIEIEFAPEEEISGDLIEVPHTIERSAPRRFAWGGVLLSALFTLVMLSIGLWATKIVEDFFARSPFLGWIALGVAGIAALAALAIILREIWALYRLGKLEALQEQAGRAINLDDRLAAQQTVDGLLSLYGPRQDMRWHVDKLKSHTSDIMDASDRVRFAERTLLDPLDEEATRIIARRARRVTLLTTVTPMAALDILFVGAQNLAMLREIATLYGGRPSAITTWKLARMVVTHLAVTGGLALSENLLHHIVGKGLLGRLSARFGEGAINGIMTSRIGLAAAAVCRPVPKSSGTRETLTGLLKAVLDFGEREKS